MTLDNEIFNVNKVEIIDQTNLLHESHNNFLDVILINL